MTPVGETLRRERLKRNLDLEEISRELKISDALPPGHRKRPVRQAPRRRFRQELRAPVRPPARSGRRGYCRPGAAGPGARAEVPQLAETAEARRRSRRFRCPRSTNGRRSATGGSAGPDGFPPSVLVAVMLVCSAVYAWMQRPKVDRDRAGQSAGSERAATGRTASRAARHAAPVASRRTPAAGAAARGAPPQRSSGSRRRPRLRRPPSRRAPGSRDEANPAEPKPAPAVARVTPPNPEATVHVEITAEEAVWVLARADGKYAFSATMDAAHHAHRGRREGSDAAPGQCGRGDDFAERQADRSGGTEGAGADDSVHFGRLPDRAGQAASAAWTRSTVSDGAAARCRLRSSVSNSRRRRFLTLSSTLCQNLAK